MCTRRKYCAFSSGERLSGGASSACPVVPESESVFLSDIVSSCSGNLPCIKSSVCPRNSSTSSEPRSPRTTRKPCCLKVLYSSTETLYFSGLTVPDFDSVALETIITPLHLSLVWQVYSRDHTSRDYRKQSFQDRSPMRPTRGLWIAPR